MPILKILRIVFSLTGASTVNCGYVIMFVEIIQS